MSVEVESECIFTTKADQVQFNTQTNGDAIRVKNLNLTQAQATSLAWLVNSSVEIEWKISIKKGKYYK